MHPFDYNKFMMIFKTFLIVGVIFYAFKTGRVVYGMMGDLP